MIRCNYKLSHRIRGSILKAPSSSFIKSLNQANQYLQQNEEQKAIDICLKLLQQGSHVEMVLKALIQIYFSIEQADKATDYLLALACFENGNLRYCEQLANVCRRYKIAAKAALAYEYFIENNPSNANGYLNFALLLKKEGQIVRALNYYNKALSLDINMPEEVLVHIAIIYAETSQEDRSLITLDKALSYNPIYVPALQNKALILEGSGDIKSAEMLYETTLELEPLNVISLTRLAYCNHHMNNRTNTLIVRLYECLNTLELSDEDQESLFYALGKIHDDIKDYSKAFEHYQQANTFSSKRALKYIPEEVELEFSQIKHEFDRCWFDNLSGNDKHEPIFIVGMFRSGSTLIEQILASHSTIVAGGELNYFPELSKNTSAQINGTEKDEISNAYLKIIHSISSKYAVTDKRPDNFLLIGLIKTVFPKAKFIWTIRDKADTCLSNYFLQLDSNMKYANSLLTLEHYYDQHIGLLNHWVSIFPKDICMVNYDKLVLNIKNEIAPVFTFLNKSWEDECQNFFKLKNNVKTASVWQVRQPLYKSSSGRAKHYESQLKNLIK